MQTRSSDALLLSTTYERKDLAKALELVANLKPSIKRLLYSTSNVVLDSDLLASVQIDDLIPFSESRADDFLIRVRNAVIYDRTQRHFDPNSFEMRGQSSQIKKLREDIAMLRDKSLPVLILGETGTGKELVARMLNYRQNLPRKLYTVNCGVIEQQMAESELFGHARGAYTSAVTSRIGAFESAAGGDLFLDEVGELGLTVQAKLLRVLNDGSYTRLGESHIKYSSARIIAATHRDLEAMIREGRFREDLFYRLNAFPLYTPSLRDRPSDIPEIARYLLLKESNGMRGLTPAAQDYLKSLRLPGNARELNNLIRRANVICAELKRPFIDREDLASASPLAAPKAETSISADGFASHMKLAEKGYLLAALERYPNGADLAKNLGMSRSKLFTLLKGHKISLQKQRPKNFQSSKLDRPE